MKRSSESLSLFPSEEEASVSGRPDGTGVKRSPGAQPSLPPAGEVGPSSRPGGAGQTRLLFERERVYDPVLRSIHAWNALAVVLLLLGGRVGEWLGYAPEAASLWRFHVWTGYGLVLGLVARLVWGLVGPRHAGLAALWQPRVWWAALRSRQLFTAPREWGHHAPATAVYLLLYALLLVMAATGLALAAIEQGRGPLYLWLGHDATLGAVFREPHELIEHVILVFVVIHIAALILHEIRHGVPLAQAMVSGFQYRKPPSGDAE